MNRSTFCKIAATVFAFVALAQAIRFGLGIPVQIGTVSVPLWVSAAAGVVAGGMAVLGFRARP